MNARLTKSNAVKDREVAWKWAQEQDRCACCHKRREHAWPPHAAHHLMNGKFGRSHERCNLLFLCDRCHSLAEMDKVPMPGGGNYPKLSLGICLTLKAESDPDNWNPARLAELYHSNLPDMESIPAVFLLERNRI